MGLFLEYAMNRRYMGALFLPGKEGNQMKEKWELFQESLTETTSMSKREFLLTLAVCVLGGIVFGLLFSPRKHTMIASNNGNNNGNGNAANQEEEEQIADWNEVEQG